jgi:hypothetical protein
MSSLYERKEEDIVVFSDLVFFGVVRLLFLHSFLHNAHKLWKTKAASTNT